ncbi:probable ATP-dependent RNA helicase DDX4 [Sycon ciliatum]
MASPAGESMTAPRFAAFRGRGLGRSSVSSPSRSSDARSEQSPSPTASSPGHQQQEQQQQHTDTSSKAESSSSRFSGGRGGFSGGHSGGADDGDSSGRPMFGGRGGGGGGSSFGGGGTGGFAGRSGGFRRNDNDSQDGEGDESSSRGGRGGGRGGRGGRGGGRFGSDFRSGDREENGGSSGGGRHGDGMDDGDRPPRDESRPPPYVPPPAPETEDELFKQNSTGLNFNKFDEIPVRLTGREPVSPVSSFEDANLNGTITENVSKSGYKKPTPVQKYAMPVIMAGRDLMACAQTGSGKTAAFILPVMSRMMKDGIDASKFAEVQSPAAIIVAPTRELVTQIWLEAKKFSHTTMLRPVVLYGGTSLGRQIREVEEGCHMVIATPGRLMDVINRRKIDLGAVKYLILDEADRMLDMGFLPSIQKLVEQLGMASGRQTLMFSATFPDEVQQLAKNFLDDYLFLTVGILGCAASDVKQSVVQVEEFGKRKKLIEILSSQGMDRTIVFVETKRTADFLASYLCQQRFPCTSIHGDRQQREREEALRDFKRGEKPVLVATSVASRGLDIQDVKHIVNFDLPSEIEDYVHRVGRTGRIGHSGLATSFFTIGKDEGIARSLVKILSESLQEVPDWLETAAAQAVGSGIHSGHGSGFGGHDMREHGGRRGGGRGGGRGGDRNGDDSDFRSNRGSGAGGQEKSWSVGRSTAGAAAQEEEESWD